MRDSAGLHLSRWRENRSCRIGAPAGSGHLPRAARADTMQPWVRRFLYALAAMLLLVAGLAVWLVRSFDGERAKRSAIEWMQVHHGRQLVIDGPAPTG